MSGTAWLGTLRLSDENGAGWMVAQQWPRCGHSQSDVARHAKYDPYECSDLASVRRGHFDRFPGHAIQIARGAHAGGRIIIGAGCYAWMVSAAV